MESAAARALAKADINFPHPNEVPQVMNEAPSVYDDEDDDNFYDNDIIFDVVIYESENTKTQVDAEEAIEDKEVNNKNDFFEDGSKSDDDEDDTPYVRRSTIVIHRPKHLIPNMPGRRVT